MRKTQVINWNSNVESVLTLPWTPINESSNSRNMVVLAHENQTCNGPDKKPKDKYQSGFVSSGRMVHDPL